MESEEITEKANSVRDDINAAIAELEGQDGANNDISENSAKGAKEAAPTTQTAPEDKDLPAQEVGKAQKEKSEPSEEAAKAAPDHSNSDVPAPISWKAEKREAFAALPLDVKKYIVDREREGQALLTQKSQEYAQAIRGHEELINVLEPEMQRFASARISPAQGVHYLLKGQEFLESNPQEAIRRLAEMHGVDLQELAQNGPAEIDPQLQTLRQELDELRGYYTSQQEQAQHQYIDSLTKHVDSFRQAKDETGNPKFPYASDPQFEEAMSYEIRKLRQMNPQASATELLQSAYDNTLWSMPDLRENELKKRTGMQEAKRISEEKAKAAKAKNLAVSVNGGPGGGGKLSSDGSVRGDILAAMEALGF